MVIEQIFASVRATLALAILTGLIFPFVITAIAMVAFPHQANGSLIRTADGKIVGSELLAQAFTKPEYFHPRPSAAGSGYAGEASGGTDLGPTSKKLIEGIKDNPETNDVDESYSGVRQLTEQYGKENELESSAAIPVDAVTRSSSGLDPHISIPNANLQAKRVAKARHLAETEVLELVARHTEGRQLGVLGEPRVNVLMLNLALDETRK